MWTKVHQFRENQNHPQNLTPHNFLVFELWPTYFGRLVVLQECFPTKTKYVDQSSPVSRKSGPKFKIWPTISAPPTGFGGKFFHRMIGGLSSCLSSKIGGPSPIPQFWGNFYPNFGVPTWPTPGQRHLWQNHVTTSQQAKHLPALGNYAIFLALGITPLDSDHAECGGMFNRYHLTPI